jgi:hypothetical protein
LETNISRDGEQQSISLHDSDKESKPLFLFRPSLPFLALLVASTCFGLSLRPSTANTTEKAHSSVRKRLGSIDKENQCQIYLAPSSLKGHAGFGIFTTRDIGKHERILSGEIDGPSVPVVDHWKGPSRELKKTWIKVWDNYWWGRGVADHVNFEARNVIDYQFGFGALPNHHCILDSLDVSTGARIHQFLYSF